MESNALYQTQTEIRHLKNTIQALRDELEAMRASKDEALQAASAAGADETRQLQSTIAALRGELEQKVFQHADDLEHQRHAANDELRLLRETITTLRGELEEKAGVEASVQRPNSESLREQGVQPRIQKEK
jgi:cell division septum initiation protein DivIVA